jgi:uncharacterized protein (DUF2235 family)
MDEAVAWYLYQHVLDGYKFLMQNYNVGDKVCLFGSSGPHGGPDGKRLTSFPGFSRGAYTARALAGMLHKVWNIRILHRTLIPT